MNNKPRLGKIVKASNLYQDNKNRGWFWIPYLFNVWTSHEQSIVYYIYIYRGDIFFLQNVCFKVFFCNDLQLLISNKNGLFFFKCVNYNNLFNFKTKVEIIFIRHNCNFPCHATHHSSIILMKQCVFSSNFFFTRLYY